MKQETPRSQDQMKNWAEPRAALTLCIVHVFTVVVMAYQNGLEGGYKELLINYGVWLSPILVVFLSRISFPLLGLCAVPVAFMFAWHMYYFWQHEAHGINVVRRSEWVWFLTTLMGALSICITALRLIFLIIKAAVYAINKPLSGPNRRADERKFSPVKRRMSKVTHTLIAVLLAGLFFPAPANAATRLDSPEFQARAGLRVVVGHLLKKYRYGEIVNIYDPVRNCASADDERESRDEVRRLLSGQLKNASTDKLCFNKMWGSFRHVSLFKTEYRINLKVFTECEAVLAFISNVIRNKPLLDALAQERILMVGRSDELADTKGTLSERISRAANYFSLENARFECKQGENELRMDIPIRGE